ncbi:dihydroxyacetone kinase subunit DhaL [Paenibacillus sp. J2TS4]|uniref:dihydroxyacetone kinase subunit DhaL n=1 Tax=Paenibacillus sp. J2TS4 TaxID=2807194 RepID=UPI001B0FD28E|nr:dihydroxyacetone kinase subunit DhaL [Paenibacillus sp. J2TS4]GIP33235.1 dihydroxyacetone kinase subunit L [Paenibacillus sp. J2TS4]
MRLSIEQFKQIMDQIGRDIEDRKDYLSELDRAVGDGDHGVTMSLGWEAIRNKLREYEGEDCGAMCKEMGMVFLNAVGSSVGPLYATAFIRGSGVLQGKAELEEEDITNFWLAAVNGIRERGKAEIGDKTMIDTWLPAAEALQNSREKGMGVAESFREAVRAGEAGMKSTAELVSRKGRSSRIGDRAVGHIDPGAASAWVILSSFSQALDDIEAGG